VHQATSKDGRDAFALEKRPDHERFRLVAAAADLDESAGLGGASGLRR
jgi:hypothetical protein